MPNIDYLIEKRKSLKSLKDPWLHQYEILGKYIYTRKQQFDRQVSPGEFLNDGMINDSTAVRANNAMASAIMGALWKSGGKTFKIKRPRGVPDTKANNNYYFLVNEIIAEAMESPKAGFEVAFHEEICEEGAFGTSGIALFRGDYENPLMFKSWSLQGTYISEGADGFVDTVYYDERVPLSNLVAKYGKDKLPGDLQKKYDNPKTRSERVVLCIGIEPRLEEDQKGEGNLGMPIASYHFLPEHKAVLLESGFIEMPVRIGRWYKLAGETMGRGPGMDSLPAVMQINSLKESFIVGVEKKVEPPTWVLDDGSLGAGTVDTSAGGMSVFNNMGRNPNQVPIGVLFDVGELQSSNTAIQDLKEEILQHFLIDRLYDLNNKTRMTLGEAELRYQIRSDALASIYARYTAEILNPLITRAFNILFDMGLLGVREEDILTQAQLISEGIDPIIIPPDIVVAIEDGKKIYDINYISPAAHIMREEEYRELITSVNNATLLQEAGGDSLIKLDVDRIMEYSVELTGAPADILLSEDEVKSLRMARNKQIQAAQEAEQFNALAKGGKDLATAESTLRG